MLTLEKIMNELKVSSINELVGGDRRTTRGGHTHHRTRNRHRSRRKRTSRSRT